MNVTKLVTTTFAATAAIALSTNTANAFSISVGGTASGVDGYKTSVVGAQTIDFNSGVPVNNVVKYSDITDNIVKGSKVSNYATPFQDETNYLTIAPKGSNAAGSTGSVTATFARALDYFGLYWGSVDTYNFVDFYFGDKLLKTITGSDVSVTAKGSWTDGKDNVYVNIFADAGEAFNKVVFRSNGIAFESDNHAFREANSEAVPEPFTIAGSAVGLAFGLRLRKKLKAAKA